MRLFVALILSVLLTSCMITLKGVKYKVLMRNLSGDTLRLTFVDTSMVTVKSPVYFGSSYSKLKWNKVNSIKDTMAYVKKNGKLTFNLPPGGMVDITGLMGKSPSGKTTLDSNDELVLIKCSRIMLVNRETLETDSIYYDFKHVFWVEKIFKPRGYLDCIRVYDVK